MDYKILNRIICKWERDFLNTFNAERALNKNKKHFKAYNSKKHVFFVVIVNIEIKLSNQEKNILTGLLLRAL